MSWSKFDADKMQWRRMGESDEKLLTVEPCMLKQRRLSEKFELQHGGDSGALMLMVDGQLTLETGERLNTDDLLWIPAGGVLSGERQGEAMFFELSVPAPLGPAHITIADKDTCSWQKFDDPAGRPTQPVQVLMEGDLSVLRTRFEPGFTAADHWHDFDAWYFITGGSMRFGHEGVYSKGEVRQVTGGYSYGPEEPEKNGVEFVLVSIGGPVALHWADLEKAPNGPLV